MTDPGKITFEAFEPCLGQTFRVTLDNGDDLALELIQVKPHGEPVAPTEGRQPFSLLFRGPEDPVLTQQLLVLSNDTLGELTLFLVPIGPADDGMRYDAVFN